MKNTIISIVILIALLVLVLFGFQKFFNRNIISPERESIQEEILPVHEIKEQYDGTTYTFAGTIDLPTPCHSLETNVVQLSESEYQIQINTVSPGEDVMCAQVISPQPYNISFDAPADIAITAQIDGQDYELSRFVVPEGEDINLFELYIKG